MIQSIREITKIPDQKNAVARVIKEAPWFSGCNEKTLNTFLAEGAIRTLSLGQAITRRGQSVSHLTLVTNGVLEVSMSSRDGRRHIVDYLGPGEFFNILPIDRKSVV